MIRVSSGLALTLTINYSPAHRRSAFANAMVQIADEPCDKSQWL